MLAIEPPRPGSVIHWHISDIMTRESGDMPSMTREAEHCFKCGSARSSGYHPALVLSERPCERMDHYWDRNVPLDHRWKLLLAMKRDDYHYPELLDGIRADGIRTALFAFPVAGDGIQLRNGHHRLAAAIELGMEAVPVKVGGTPTHGTRIGWWNSDHEANQDAW